MSLLNLQTDLKDLKFGVGPSYDRPGLANSGQPYETVPLPLATDSIPPSYEDFLLRGGINGARDTETDLKRLIKFFNDTKSPSGKLFITKQNLLSRIGVRTQTSGVGFNEGVYNPLSTLAQAGISIEGGHIPKQGLLPFRGPVTYLETVKKRSKQGGYRIIGENDGEGNRLVDLFQSKINSLPLPKNKNNISLLPTELLSYKGGPDSVLSLGNTRIPIALTNQGAPLQTGKENIKLQNSGFFNIPPTPDPIPGVKKDNIIGGFDVFTIEKQRKFSTVDNTPNTITDFREDIYKIRDQKISYVTGIAPSYDPWKNRTIDGPEGSRVNYVSPGQRGNIRNYSAGKRDPITGDSMGPVDKINALPIYKSSTVAHSDIKNDLVKFRIATIDNDNPNKKEFIHFRAFIDSFSDSYSSTWDSQEFMGRGEKFYKYRGFDRKVNLSFTVAAQSREEIMIMYKKLNYLASNLAPHYTDAGYMAGPLVQLTLGGWCYELPGFISALTLNIPVESPWEISIPDTDEDTEDIGGIKYRDEKVKEMPMICQVTGFTFTPIHRFRPQKQKNTFSGETKFEWKNSKGKDKSQIVNTIEQYGPERYIQLENGGSSAYKQQSKDPIIIPPPKDEGLESGK